jgi:SEC-C motif-containing protein
MNCPCGSGLPYDACCGRYHRGGERPATAAALMRSRYAAYAVGAIDYLFATHDPATVRPETRDSARQWAETAGWLRLDVVAARQGGEGDEGGLVEFIAWYEQDGRLRAHHERSRFRRLDGDWVYVDGKVVSADGGLSRLGRNDPCPCGSGRKHKQCHGG